MGFLDKILGHTVAKHITVPKRVRRNPFVGDVVEDVRGIGPLVSMTGRAVAHDAPFLIPGFATAKIASNVARGRSPISGFEKPNAMLTLGAQAVVGNTGYQARALGEDPEDAPIIMGPDGKLYRNKKGGGLAYLLGPVLDNVPKDVLEQARKEARGLSLLKEDPLNVPLAFIGTAGAAGRSVMIGKLAKNIQRANKGMTAKEAMKLARREITRPGLVESKGLDGGIPARVIKGQYGEAPGRMRSRSSLGRGLQRGWDAASEAVDARRPESRWSSSSRAQASEAKAASRVAKRQENAVTQVEIDLKKALGRKWHQTARDAPLTQRQQDIMTGLTVALEHGDLSFEDAVAARLKLYESVLSGGVSASMGEGEIAKLGSQLERQMDDLTDHQKGVLDAYAHDLRRAERKADVAEAQALRLAQRRTPEERQAIRDRLGLNPSVKRSEAEFVKLDERLNRLKREHEALATKIEDLLTNPNMAPSKRNRGLSSATRQLTAKAAQLAKTRQEFRDALAWGHDVSDEARRFDYVVDIAEGGAENQLFDARRTQEAMRRRVQVRERRLGDRQESSNALLQDERAALDKAFDDMVANPRKSTPVSALERRQIEAQMAELNRALAHPRNEAQFRKAVQGLRTLAEWVDESGRKIAKMGLDDDAAAQIDEVFNSRQRLVGEEMVRRGILTPEQAGGAYFPHYSMWSNAGKEVGKGHGVSGPLVDGPNLNDYILNMHDNDLQLLQKGMVDMSPTTMGNLLRNRLRYLSTHEAVQKLYAEGDAPPEDMSKIGHGWALIRNPDAPKRKVPERMAMAYSDPRRYWENVAREKHDTPVSDEIASRADLTQDELKALTHRSAEEARLRFESGSADPDGTGFDLKGDLDEGIVVDYDPSKPLPEWAKQTRNFKVIPSKVAKARLGEALMKAPDSDGLAMFNTLNMAIRASVLYSPYLGTRYVARNAIQNATLLALTHPGGFRHIKTAVDLQTGSPAERALFREMAVEGGTVAAQAGLPEITTNYLSGPRKLERGVGKASGKVANVLGDIADEPFRVAAWIGYAKRYDFDTPDEWRELMTEPKHAKLRDEISQRVREDLLDFDAAGPAERAVLNRVLFLYPFLRASSKWPFMYAREYPIRTALAGTLAHEAPTEDEYTNMPQSVRESDIVGEKNWSIWDPTAPLRQQIENVQAVTQGTLNNQGGEGALDNVHPLIGLGIDWATGNPSSESLKRLFPLIRTKSDIQRGGSDLGKQGEMFAGMEVRPPAHIRKETRQMASKLTTTLEWAAAQGHPVDASKLQPTFDAWKEWKALDYRAQRAAKDKGYQLGEEEIAVLYAQFLSKRFGVPVPSEAQLRQGNSAQREVWKRDMDDKAWGPINDPISELRTKLRDLMLKGYTLDQIKEKTGIDVGVFAEDLK